MTKGGDYRIAKNMIRKYGGKKMNIIKNEQRIKGKGTIFFALVALLVLLSAYSVHAEIQNIDPDVDDGFSSYAECFGGARWRNFMLDGNGWELAVGDPNTIGNYQPYWDNLDFVYAGDYFFSPGGPNTFTYIYNATTYNQTVDASIDGGFFSRTYNNGSLGLLDYLQIDVVGRNGQTVEFNNVVLSIGSDNYDLGDFVAGVWKSWYVTDVDLTNGFSITGDVWLTNESTCEECSKINVYVGKLPDCCTEAWVDDDADSIWYDWNHVDSIQTAVDRVCNDGGIIHVFNGTYGLTEEENQDGYQTALLIDNKQNLTIEAMPGHEPVLMPDTMTESDIVTISIENSNNLVIDNIDSDQTIAQFDHWHVFNSDNLTVKNCVFHGGEDGIDVNTELNIALIENNVFMNITTGSGDEVLDFTDAPCADIIIQDNIFDYNYRHMTFDNGDSNVIIRRNMFDGTNSEEAIRLIDASNVIVENNIIMHNTQQGVYIDSGCSSVTIQHNTFYQNDQENNGNGEIRTKVHSSDIIIKNNIMYGSETNPAFETTADSLPSEDYNCVYNTVDNGFSFGVNTLLDENPQFMRLDVGNEDFHLQDNSSCIDSGIDLGVSEDFENNPRDGNPDRGAYEYLENVDVEQPVFNRGFPIRHAEDGDWGGAQNFTPTTDVITSVQIYMRTFGTPEFDLTVELRENDPEGTLIDSITFMPSETPNSWTWFSIDFTDSYVSNDEYFIVCPPAPSGVTTSNGYEWAYAFGNQYDDGSFWFTRDGGDLWRDLPGMYEFTFKTYGY